MTTFQNSLDPDQAEQNFLCASWESSGGVDGQTLYVPKSHEKHLPHRAGEIHSPWRVPHAAKSFMSLTLRENVLSG